MAKTAIDLGCEAVQIFSRSPRGGIAKALVQEDVSEMGRLFLDHDVWPLVVHAPYFINLAATDPQKKAYSIEVLSLELERARFLGAPYVVTHIGHKLKDEPPEAEEALSRVADSIRRALEESPGPTKLLLENTAGQGQELGVSFQSIAWLLGLLPKERVGACLDTCHAFGGGYDLSTAKGVEDVLTKFDNSVGLANLGAIHLNDSKGVLGGHTDRHENIGKGMIGIQGFRALIRDSRLPEDLCGLLETPLDTPNAGKHDLELVKKLRL